MFFLYNIYINFLKFIYFDPLEQFDVFKIDFIINNLLFFAVLLFSLKFFWIFLSQNFSYKKKNWNLFSFISAEIFSFVKTLVNTNIVLSRHFFFTLGFFIFIIILFSNITGLIPYSFTITSSFIITFLFALILLFIINIIAIYTHGFHQFIGFFLPRGTPFMIALILVFIEMISYFARLFSLSIRLFANMMAGHTLLKILIGFSFTILFTFTIFSPFAIFPWIIVSCIVILEILIAFLQAYVFLISICIYCNDVLHLH